MLGVASVSALPVSGFPRPLGAEDDGSAAEFTGGSHLKGYVFATAQMLASAAPLPTTAKAASVIATTQTKASAAVMPSAVMHHKAIKTADMRARAEAITST